MVVLELRTDISWLLSPLAWPPRFLTRSQPVDPALRASTSIAGPFGLVAIRRTGAATAGAVDLRPSSRDHHRCPCRLGPTWPPMSLRGIVDHPFSPIPLRPHPSYWAAAIPRRGIIPRRCAGWWSTRRARGAVAGEYRAAFWLGRSSNCGRVPAAASACAARRRWPRERCAGSTPAAGGARRATVAAVLCTNRTVALSKTSAQRAVRHASPPAQCTSLLDPPRARFPP